MQAFQLGHGNYPESEYTKNTYHYIETYEPKMCDEDIMNASKVRVSLKW